MPAPSRCVPAVLRHPLTLSGAPPAVRLLFLTLLLGAALLVAPEARAQEAEEVTLIHEIQGAGAESPLAGQVVTIEGVVVGDFQPGDGDFFETDLGGFFVEEEEGDFDDNPETSEGIFVFTGDASASIPDVEPGDLVRLTGEVAEFFNLTELTSVSSLEVVGTAPLPPFAEVMLPIPTPDFLERFEGMRVHLPQALVIAEYFNFDRFGEVTLALPPEGLERPFQPTSYLEPGPEGEEIQIELERRRITLDDARTSQNPTPARHPDGEAFTLENRFRGGDMVESAVGVLNYSFGLYRLQPTEGAAYMPENPRPEQPESVGSGALRVATFNTLNYFLTLDEEGAQCGPEMSLNCRGADNEEEFERQRAKLLSALEGLNASVVGLVELENTTGVEPAEDLAEGLNERLGEEAYGFVETGTIGTDAIKVGLLYRTDVVAPVGEPAFLTEPEEVFIGVATGRVPLAQTFEEAATGERFTVVVNHFKAKTASGLDCPTPDADPNCDQGDGQGFFNEQRTRAARAVVEWLATDPTGSGDEDYLIIGDLNAYDEEDPIDALKAGPDGEPGTEDDYADLLEQYQGETAYSYLFDAQFGHIDYAFSSAALTPQATGATAWHINADEPDILNYDTSFKPEEQVELLFEVNAYRSSDHDPVLAGLQLGGAPVADATPPACGPIAVDRDAEPPTITSSASDPESGIASITFTRLQNLDGFYAVPGEEGEEEDGLAEGDAVAFDAGAVQEVSFGGARTSASEQRVAVIVTVENGAGLTAQCDPVLSEVDAGVPTAFALEGNYPNPVPAGGTAIRFAVPEASEVTLEVYDVLGRKVATLVDREMKPGSYEVAWRAEGLPSGTYVYRMRAGSFTESRTMTLVR